MKKLIFVFVVLIFILTKSNAQDTIVRWSFPSGSADSLTDGGIPLNSGSFVGAYYGTFGSPVFHNIIIDYSTNGSQGAPDKCAKATGWNDGSDSAYWLINFKTTGYSNLKLYSKQQSGGTYPGPRDWKVQYKLAGAETWNDIPGGVIVCANNWISGVLNGIDIPQDCDNQMNDLSFRWLLTSNIDINGTTLQSTGIAKFDDIVVTGTSTAGIDRLTPSTFEYFPNPNKSRYLHIRILEKIKLLTIYNLQCQKIISYSGIELFSPISLEFLKPGIYFIRAEFGNNQYSKSEKLIVE